VLLHLDSAAEAGVVVSSQHGHGRLHQNSAGIHLLAHQVGRAAGQGHPGRQGLTDGIKPPEAGQQGGVDVDQPVWESADQGGGDHPHPPRHHHQIHGSRLKAGHQGPVELVSAGMVPVIVQLAGNPQPLGPLLGAAAAVVHHQQGHIGLEVALPAGLHQGLEVAAGTGGHHPQPQGAGLRCAGRCAGHCMRVCAIRWQRPLDAGPLIARV